MTRLCLALAPLMVLPSLAGCGPAPTSASGPPAKVTVHYANPGTTEVGAGEDVGPIVFSFRGARGHVRLTMALREAGAVNPFIHDALFLANGDGRLSIAIRKPWPGHERGRVSIRCEADGEDSTVVYEPALWYGDPQVDTIRVEAPDGREPAYVREGAELHLARIAAGPKDVRTIVVNPVSLSFGVTFAAEPIKPRVKAGVRPPR